MRGTLNLRLLLLVTGAALVCAVGWFFLHRYQKNRKQGEYLVQATRAEEENNLDRAARLLRAYVLAVPSDADARVRYGGLLEKLGKTPRAKSDALAVYEQALIHSPDRLDARRRAAELAVELGRSSAALGHLKALIDANAADGRVFLLLGITQEARGQYSEAVASYTKSAEADPKPEAFVRRAGVLKIHLKQDDDEANGKEVGPQSVLNELVVALPNSFESYLARAAYHKTYARDKPKGLARARADLETARKLAPDEPAVLLASAQVVVETAAIVPGTGDEARAAREGHWNEARGYLRHGLTKAPKEAALYLALADVETRAGRRDEAIRVLADGRKGVRPGGLPEILFALAEQHAEAGDQAGTDDAVAQLKKLNQDATRIDLLRGLCLVRRGQWYEGSGILERVRPLLATDPAKTVQIDLLLAQCYGNLGDLDRQLLTYRRAVSTAPLDYRPRLGLAGALAALGRSTEAADEYRHITQMTVSPPGAWVALARLLVYRNLTRPAAERQWDEVDRLLAAAGKVVKDSVEIPLLEAEVLAAKGDREGAKKRLTAARDARPKEHEFWIALAVLTDRAGQNDAARAILKEAGDRLGDTVELRIARLRVTEYRSKEQSKGAVDALAAGADTFPPDDRVRLFRSLAAAYWLIDEPAAAAALWAQVAALRPTELAVRLLQFDAALKLDDDAAMQRILGDVRRIEGTGPLEKYGTAARLIWLAGRGDRSGLGEARNLLAAAAARRPGWSRIPLALARVEELAGNPDMALEHLKRAIELGDRQLSVVRRAVQLLDDRGQVAEADKILRQLEEQAPISNDLQRLAAQVSLRLDVDRAVDLARKAVGANAKDYKERVWLGRILSAGGRAAEAEAEFEAAAAVPEAAAGPEAVWVPFVQHVARRKGADPAKAESVLKRADAALAGKRPVELAICYELLGTREEAEKRYLAAIKANPADADAVRKTAEFYQRSGDPAKAEPFLRQLVSADLKARAADVAWGRRNLALALGLRTESPDFEGAIRLLDANAAAGEQADDIRTRALVTATRPGRRQEVIGLLERAEKVAPPAPEHEFLLARLYEAEGNWPKARERLLRLISFQKDNARYVEAFARSLMRRGELSEAEAWANRLADAPGALSAVALRVELACRLGRAADALPVVRRFADAKDGAPADPAQRALAAADLFDQVSWAGGGKDAVQAAERAYTRHKELSKRPEAALPLAGFYGRNNDPDKALALCEEALNGGAPLEQVIVASFAATANKAARDAHFATVEGWLNRALAGKPNAADPRFLLGVLRDQQGRFADAEAEYRKVLAQVPTHAGALNNLTFLLAVRGKGAEAVRTAERAFAATPVAPPALLDTRGVAHTAAGDLAAAKRDLEAAAAAEGLATAYFHLAVVHAQLKDKPKATAALRQARNAGLRLDLLHPLERPTYEALVAELKP